MKKSLYLIVLGLLAFSSIALSQGKFSGYMFGDYYFNVARDTAFNHTAPSINASSSAAPGAKSMQAFQIRRIYLGYDNEISENFSARLRLEADQGALISPVSATNSVPNGDVLTSGKVGMFVKDAYLKWKNIFPGSDLTFGVQPPQAYEVSEAAWGYRSIEKTIMDLRGIVSSRDLGISLSGKLVSDGMFKYWVMIANGAGTGVVENDKYKRYYAQLYAKPIANLQASLYVDYKDVANVLDANKNSVSNGTMTEALFVGYAEPFQYNVGLEVAMTSQSNAYTPAGGTLGSKNGLGISVFGSYSVLPELAVLGRYDSYDPNTHGSSVGDLRTYIIAGLSYKADKNVSIQPNILYETYEAPKGGSTPDASVTARVTFYYVFL